VRFLTVNDILHSATDTKPFLIKIDIEGFERDLFAGSLDWLDTVALVFIEPHDWMLPGSRSSSGLQKAFGDRDFDLLLCGENLVYVSRRILARH
jgi:hypothetical protein